MRFLLSLIALFMLINPVLADVRFLSISDIHYGTDNTTGDGHDTDSILLSSALSKFSLLTKHVDFVITLGDFPTHMLRYSPKKEGYIKSVFHGLYQADQVGIPMFYITGNNDSLSGNYQPFSWSGKSPLTLATDWQGACAHCEGLIIDGTHMYDEGYYSSYVLPGNKDIVLIVLNSIQFVKSPIFAPKYPNQKRDALQQLRWLEKQLKNNHAKQLMIAMHIPPGSTYHDGESWQEPYLKQFIDLLNMAYPHYGQISLLTAHTHMDDIRKIHLENGKNIYSYATPSISRNHHNNPGMKIFDLNANLQLKDFTTYYTTVDQSWQNEHYSAIKEANNMFPTCQGKILAQCLDTLSNESVCKSIIDGRFYGVKSPRVDNTACKLTYPVN